MRGIGLALATLVIALAAGAPPAFAAADRLIDVRGNGGVRSFGLFDPNRADPNTTAAAAVFGSGTVLSDTDASCLIHYFSSGVGILFADFGSVGVSACDPSAGKAQELYASGPGWQTNRGLAIGQRLKRLKKLYREKRLGKARWELIGKKSPIGPTGHQTVLSAIVVDRKVIQFQVWAGRAGE